MNTTVASILSLALVACSAPPDEPYQGSGSGDAPSGSDTSQTGSSSFRKRADGCSHIRYWRLKERRQYRGSRVDGGVDGPCLDRLDELDRKWPERSEQRDGRS